MTRKEIRKVISVSAFLVFTLATVLTLVAVFMFGHVTGQQYKLDQWEAELEEWEADLRAWQISNDQWENELATWEANLTDWQDELIREEVGLKIN